MHNVRTTFQPDKPIEIGDAEYEDLQRQGLLVEDGKATKKKSTPDDNKDGGDAGTEK
ncbi:hypothetical protein [Lentzea guizhouensis]|uniref:hypothetical protein n=1 Tax=Lentzea guizhouensis TaxID=1586287 RepID=UPI0012B6834A|nr:hypothetical protein [Lentzea guizhouensis]